MPTSGARSLALGLLLATVLPLTAARAQQLGAASHVNPTPAGSLPLTLDVEVSLAHLHPGASQGGLECGAIVRPGDWVKSHRGEITDYASADKLVLSPAHYLGQSGSAAFALSPRGLRRQRALLDRAHPGGAHRSCDPRSLVAAAGGAHRLLAHAQRSRGGVGSKRRAPRRHGGEHGVRRLQPARGRGAGPERCRDVRAGDAARAGKLLCPRCGGGCSASRRGRGGVCLDRHGRRPSNPPGQNGDANPSQASLNPQPISLQVGFNAAGSFQTPQPQSIQVQLTAGGKLRGTHSGAVSARTSTPPAPSPCRRRSPCRCRCSRAGRFRCRHRFRPALTLQAAGGFLPPAP